MTTAESRHQGLRRGWPWLVPDLPECSIEEMANGLVPNFGIGHHDVLKSVFALEQADGTLKERLRKGRIDNVRRGVPEHLSHILVEDFAVHLLETQEVFLRELRAMAVVERLHYF